MEIARERYRAAMYGIRIRPDGGNAVTYGDPVSIPIRSFVL
jgi:hypothetical protein